MRVIVTGGRDFEDAKAVERELSSLPAGSWIISGGATGADSLADEYARENRLGREVYQANWGKLGRSAGPKRNQRMVDAGADLLIAFPGGRGTKDCIKRAEKAGIPVKHVGP